MKWSMLFLLVWCSAAMMGSVGATPSRRKSLPRSEFPPSASKAQRLRMTRFWEKKVVRWKVVGKRSRSYRCRRLRSPLRNNVRLQLRLLRRLGWYGCDRNVWKKCQRKNARKRCKRKRIKLRWSACYHIERRLSLVVEQILGHRKKGKRWRCSWRFKIPDRFAKIHFAPYPKLSEVQKDR